MGTALGVRAGAAMVVASALGGCFDPDTSQGVCMMCDDKCPSGLECRNGYCVDPSSSKDCSQGGSGATSGSGTGGSSSGGSGKGGSMNAAGAANASSSGGTGASGGSGGAGAHGGGKGGTGHGGAGGSMHAGGTGGSPYVGGTTGATDDGGTSAGGENGGTGGGCGITADGATACSGQEFTLNLSVACGSAPFRWRITKGGDGLVLDAHGSAATISGVIGDPGDHSVSVSVTDADDISTRRDLVLHVHDTPVVTTASLPNVCANELYSATLAAEGGDGANYEWSGDVAAESGLVIADGKLGGTFKPTGTSSIDVTLQVQSDGCTSAPVTLSLAREASANCPDIVGPGQFESLAMPCRGNDYDEMLIAKGPSGDYVWSEVSVPPGLHFDVNTQHVQGTSTGAGELTVDVTGAGHSVEKTFEITPRDACWLAYIAPVNGVARLGLFDPVTKAGRTTPSDPNADPVTDFKFSPDGRFLVYRTGVSSDVGQLTLVEMPNPVEHPLGFDVVTHYAWSEDSSTLAVSFTSASGTALGGVDVAHPQLGATITYPELTPLGASVDSELVWYAGTHVAFQSARTQSLWPIHSATYAGGGFGTPLVSDSDFGAHSELRPGATGVFIVPSSNDPVSFYGLDFFGDPNDFPGPDGDVFDGIPHADFPISGTGRYVAGVADGTLQVFVAGNPSDPDFYPLFDAEKPGCDAVLGWAPASDRVACSQNVGGPGDGAKIVFFDVSTGADGTTTIADPVAIDGVSDYLDLFPSGRQRLFSHDGSRFAFTTATRVSVAQIGNGASSLVLHQDFEPAPGADDAVVAFAPNGHFVAEHRGNYLMLYDLTRTPSLSFVVRDDLPLSQACEEGVRAPAGASCGVERAQASFAWSPDADAIAHANAAGELWVTGLTELEAGLDDPTRVAADCGACLSGQSFAFQP